ncbi:MAG: cupin domain-containing protein [Thermoplasmata archaeon]
MKHLHYAEIEQKDVEDKGAKDVRIRWLVTKDDGAEHFAMRRFEISPGGHTPRHSHDFEHEVFVLEGAGTLAVEDREESLASGDVVFLPANIVHQFVNDGDQTLSFLCLIPYGD